MAARNSQPIRVEVHHHSGCLTVFKWLVVAFLGMLVLGMVGSVIAPVPPDAKPNAAKPSRPADAGTRVIARWADPANRCVVEFERQGGVEDMHFLNLTFSRPLPERSTVDKLVASYLRKAAKKDGSRKIFAAAFVGDDALSAPEAWSGYKVLDPGTGKIESPR